MTTDLSRYRAPSALAHMQPAATAPATALVRLPRVRMVAPYVRYHTLLEEARRRERAGTIRLLQPKPVWSHERGQWEILTEQLKPPRPRWVKPVIITGTVLTVLSALTLAGLWVFATLAAIPGAVFLGLVLVLFLLFVASTGKRGSRGVTEVLVSVLVRVR